MREVGDKKKKCKDVCGMPATLNENAKCKSGKWAPDYTTVEGCNCLTEYKCCGGKCPAVNVKSCWGKDKSQKGTKSAIKKL